MADVIVGVGQTRPYLAGTITRDDGNPVPLTGCSVAVQVIDVTGTVLRTAPAGAVTIDPNQVADDAGHDGTHAGYFTYAWQPDDVVTVGDYGLVFVVTYPDDSTESFPNGGALTFTVSPVTTDPYLVTPEECARIIGIPLPLPTDGQIREILADMIDDAQGDAEVYLGRPVVPTVITETVAWDPTEPYGLALTYDPVSQITNTVNTDPDLLGYYGATVTYVAGITDLIAVRAIKRWVKSAAIESFRDSNAGASYRLAYSVSSDGESISYGARRTSTGPAAGITPAGTPPTLESLSPWRKRGVFSRRRLIGAQGTAAGMGMLVYPGYGQSAPTNPDGTVADGWYRNTITGEVSPTEPGPDPADPVVTP